METRPQSHVQAPHDRGRRGAVQRWKSGKYADHGTKLLRFWRDGRGRQRIIYEDMLNSEPGWRRGPDGDVAKLDWSTPKTIAEADKLWRELAPTGDDYDDKLAAIPEDPALRRMLARALIAGGNFACDETVYYEPCGGDMDDAAIDKMLAGATSGWAPLSATATFDEPCLRRRLALWSLGFLSAEDLANSRKQLVAIAKLRRPEQELVDEVLSMTTASRENTTMMKKRPKRRKRRTKKPGPTSA